MGELNKKLKYTTELTREHIKQFTRYDEFKDRIDAITGQNNLDFPFSKAEASEFVIKITMADGDHLFLPIFATDGKGYRYDEHKGYSTIHRPMTEQEEKAVEDRKKWEAEKREENKENLTKAERLAKKKAERIAKKHIKSEVENEL